MIYYIFEYNASLIGVYQKILSKIRELQSLDTNIKGLMIYSDENLDLFQFDDTLLDLVYYEPYVGKRIYRNRVLSFLNVYYKNKHFYNFLSIEINKRNPKAIIRRYGNEDKNSLRFLNSISCEMIYELNTIQYKQNVKSWSYKGLFRSPIWIYYTLKAELYYGKRCLNKSATIICVTDEIARDTLSRLPEKSKKKVHVISNGIKSDNITLKNQSTFDDSLNLLMIRGVDAPWHGFEIVYRAIQKSTLNIKFFVVGEIGKKVSDERVNYTGKLDSMAIEKLINEKNIHIGIGSLALDLAGLKEASPLKVREYLARGLPVVYNYHDTDLKIHKDFSNKYCYFLKGELNLDLLKKWYFTLQKEDDFEKVIRNWAVENIDYKVKMNQYKSAIEL